MSLSELGRSYKRWLFDAALPLWLEHGLDHARGGWFDKLDQDGIAIEGAKRTRVQARQIFVFAYAGRLGWNGDWQRAVTAGLDFMLNRLRRDDGLFAVSVDAHGNLVNDSADLYDQAFVLFALASAYDALGRPPELLAKAQSLLELLRSRLRHPHAGFEEAVPRVLPLRSNPHMHMLEAMLAWMDAGVSGLFEAVAREIVGLALERLIDPQTGAIGEYYDGDWALAAEDGHIREPGHQFEWAYLLHECGHQLNLDLRQQSMRMFGFAETHGVVEGRTIFSLDQHGAAIDRRSRLWATTERLRTTTVLSQAEFLDASAREKALHSASQSANTLASFLAVKVKGLWSDWLDEDGRLIIEPVPASSLYHIVTGIAPAIELLNHNSDKSE